MYNKILIPVEGREGAWRAIRSSTASSLSPDNSTPESMLETSSIMSSNSRRADSNLSAKLVAMGT